ncbi:MAG: hypothetical protein IJE28_07105, partial [Oscillospiraceae bacterium]|nr:hypothetical protein [Oscillospiraceae bacterium]
GRIISAPTVGKKISTNHVGVRLALTRKKEGDRKGRPYIILRNHHTSAENLYRIPPSASQTPPFRQGGLSGKGLLEKMHKKKGFFAPFALFHKGRKGGFYHFCPVGEIKNGEFDKNP